MKNIVVLALHLGTGGIENAISSLSNILCEKYNVKIISTYKVQEKPAFTLDKRIKIEYLINDRPNKAELIKAVKKLQLIRSIREIYKAIKILILKKYRMINAIKKLDADIVISTRDIHNEWLGKYGSKQTIKIAQEHNHHNNNKKYINKVVKSLKNIDYFMPTSKELADFYKEKLKNTKTKVEYIRNSISYYPQNISSLDSKNIISVGRLSPEKGYLDLIDVYIKIQEKYPDWKLRIVGDGSQREELEEKIKENKMEAYIELTGFKNKQELETIELDSSIYVMTSFTESFGLVLIEAESYGLPIVVFDSAQGAHEIVEEGLNGYLIKNRDKDEMVNKIIQLIESKELRKKIGNEGRKLSSKYKKEEVAQIWYNFIDSSKKQV